MKNLEITKTSLSDSGNTILVQFCPYKVIAQAQAQSKTLAFYQEELAQTRGELLGATEGTLKMQL